MAGEAVASCMVSGQDDLDRKELGRFISRRTSMARHCGAKGTLAWPVSPLIEQSGVMLAVFLRLPVLLIKHNSSEVGLACLTQ
jgi:hypothetical protein